MLHFMVRLTDGRRETIEADFYDFDGDWVRFWNRPVEGEAWEQLAAARALMVHRVDPDSEKDSEEGEA